jgi:hypothetical protein
LLCPKRDAPADCWIDQTTLFSTGKPASPARVTFTFRYGAKPEGQDSNGEWRFKGEQRTPLVAHLMAP